MNINGYYASINLTEWGFSQKFPCLPSQYKEDGIITISEYLEGMVQFVLSERPI